jgi:MscS family membrane protein
MFIPRLRQKAYFGTMIRQNGSHYLWLLWVLLLAGALPANGQQDQTARRMLGSPHATMYTHLYYLQHDSYDPALAARTIPPTVDPARTEKLAIQLKQILDGRGLYVRLNMIPQDPTYMDSATMAHIYTPFPKQLPEVYLEKIDSLWYYAAETVVSVPVLHRKLYPLGADLLSRRMPDSLRTRILGITVWQYLGLLAIILAAWILQLIISRGLRPVIRWIAHRVHNLGYAEPRDIKRAARYISYLFVLYSCARVFPVLQLPIRWSQFVVTSIAIVSAVLWVLLCLVLVKVITTRFRALADATDSKMDDQILPIVRKLLQILIVTAGIVVILTKLDINVTALIAGLSIGALAVALAAQDTVKNLIGSLMIFIDKPFQVGDFVNLDGKEGTIVEVGFRSTRIQTVDTSIVSIPNGTVANTSITNLGVRQFRLMNVLIGVTYDTPPEKIAQFIDELKQLIERDDRIHKENYFVHFREMGDFALKIIFRCYIPVYTFPEELKIKEDIYLEIMRIAQRLSIEFAFPSQTIYLEK